MKTFVIFAGGELDEEKTALPDGCTVICADSGYKHILVLGILPDIIVGDFDSYTGELPETAEIIRSVPEKDDTDTMLAVKTAIDRGAEQIIIYGALGGRLDHTIANLQTLIYIHRHGCIGRIESKHNTAEIAHNGLNRYDRNEHRYFSVFAASDDVVVKSLRGVKYPLTDYRMTTGFPIGVSNEIIDKEALLELESGIAYIIRSE